ATQTLPDDRMVIHDQDAPFAVLRRTRRRLVRRLEQRGPNGHCITPRTVISSQSIWPARICVAAFAREAHPLPQAQLDTHIRCARRSAWRARSAPLLPTSGLGTA